MLINPIAAMLYNTATSRWHPIYFSEHPMPGGKFGLRWKSKAHHPGGFATRDEAVADAMDMCAKIQPEAVGRVYLAMNGDIEWDGSGVPAMVQTFNLDALAQFP